MSQYEKTCLIRADAGRAIRAVLDRIGDKWTLLVVATLHERRMRFTELQRHIPGISQRMLSLTLRHLGRDGLVTRTAHAEVPPRVEYELTQTGPDPDRTRRDTGRMGRRTQPDIEQSQKAYDSRSH
jgi:DNA-binding HxlR family transcriptional regulator